MLKQELSIRSSGRLPSAISTVLMIVVAFLLAGIAAPARADQPKPSEALKQVNKMAEAIDRELDSGKIKPEELEARLDSVVRFAAERAAGYMVADWKGDELYALASLYQRAEQFQPAADAWRGYLGGAPKGEKGLNAMASQVRCLIEVEKFDEATAALETLERSMPLYRGSYVPLLIARIALHKDLATAYHNLGQYEKTARQARAGYMLMFQLGKREIEMMDPLNREARDHDQAALASLVIVSLHRVGRTNEAAEFRRQVERSRFASPRMLSVFQSELVAANLINSNSPSIALQRWLGATVYKPEDFKGKVVILHFWAMWSAPSAEAFPRLRALEDKYGSQDLVTISITRFYGRSDKEDDLKPEQEWKSLQEFVKRYDVRHPIAVGREDDLTNDDHFSVISLPTIVLVDRKGKIRAIRRGAGNWRALEKQVARLIEEKE